MDTIQIQLVKASFTRIVPQADEAATLFYQRLFELDSSLRPLFPHDIQIQGKKLMDTLTVMVESLATLDIVAPGIWALGQRHKRYGVVTAHYETVGCALLWMLAHLLGESFTPETEQAWTETYGLLSAVMQRE